MFIFECIYDCCGIMFRFQIFETYVLISKFCLVMLLAGFKIALLNARKPTSNQPLQLNIHLAANQKFLVKEPHHFLVEVSKNAQQKHKSTPVSSSCMQAGGIFIYLCSLGMLYYYSSFFLIINQEEPRTTFVPKGIGAHFQIIFMALLQERAMKQC